MKNKIIDAVLKEAQQERLQGEFQKEFDSFLSKRIREFLPHMREDITNIYRLGYTTGNNMALNGKNPDTINDALAKKKLESHKMNDGKRFIEYFQDAYKQGFADVKDSFKEFR